MTQISFFDDPVRCAQMCNRLADELEQRIKDGVSVVPEGTKRILITGTPLAVRTGNYITSSRQAALLLSAKRCVQEQDILKIL